MTLPPQPVDSAFEALLQELPLDIAASAREFGAFARGRKIQSPQALLRVVLLYCGLDQSLREIAGTQSLIGAGMSDEAVRGRLQVCEPWVKALLGAMLSETQRAALPQTRRWVVCDGSTVQAPGAKGIDYRLHIGLDLVRLELCLLEVSERSIGEKLSNFAFEAGDVALVDRGYCHREGLWQTLQGGTQVVVRLNAHNLPLHTQAGEVVDVVGLLRAQAASRVCIPVWLHAPAAQAARAPVWVHAFRLPAPEAAEARRRCRRNAKAGRHPKASTLYLAGWVLIVSTLAPSVLDSELIGTVYRLRWQVELVIKRWKSLLDLDQLRARRDSPLATLWLHGKLLYAQLLERYARRQVGPHWGRLDQPRTATPWRLWKLLKRPLDTLISGVMCWDMGRWHECQRRLAERRRQRRLQQVPLGAQRLRFALPSCEEPSELTSLPLAACGSLE